MAAAPATRAATTTPTRSMLGMFVSFKFSNIN
jgi:hypothetical protein